MEETCAEILERYLDYNKHAGSYTWKRLGHILDMEATLEENGVSDETDTMTELGLPDDYYVPALHLYYNDGIYRSPSDVSCRPDSRVIHCNHSHCLHK